MNNRKAWLVLLPAVLVLIAIVALTDNSSSIAENRNLSKVTFVVSWYDVGEEVLAGLKGIALFDSDVRGYQEIHNVWYDPAVISVEEMESALQEASTHLATER